MQRTLTLNTPEIPARDLGGSSFSHWGGHAPQTYIYGFLMLTVHFTNESGIKFWEITYSIRNEGDVCSRILSLHWYVLWWAPTQVTIASWPCLHLNQMGVWLRGNSENSIIPTEFEGDAFSYMFCVVHCRKNCQL